MNDQLIKKNEFRKSTSEIIQSTRKHISAGLTGILASDKKEIVLSVGHVFQRLQAGKFLSGFLEEWNKYVEKGRVKDDYETTEQHAACLQELLSALDNDMPDEERFRLLKKIFLTSAMEPSDLSDRDSSLPLQFMQIGRSLSTGEILVLFAAYKINNEKESLPKHLTGRGECLKRLASKSGLQYIDLVRKQEDLLVEKNLFRSIEGYDGRNIRDDNYFRLTELGYRFCEFVNFYDKNQNE